LTRNIHAGTDADAARVARLAAYVRETARTLAAIDGAALQRGQIAFADPQAFAAHEPAGAP
jgi:hypothetical protein